ncbi:phytanoyl-CoA dioxygenase family protein [Kribbella jiaozuonensis]|uniref:Phytanoyl-CoA dioxygenase family protein n=1 Tax=Kribbella jiaozuonensis TaxID=2575441 RepID=A0A4V5UXW8_9ACTN|nr:phytanoyl-CoA dioxygenase family protein [Kribbella jiaozuonensis]TKK82233.1 phytanoyl-CoA dioxygenase family protein [Kribbella jiaozuonensis]
MELPGADDIAFYREHGYWISPVIVPSDVLDAAERGMERFYAGDHDHALPDLPATRGWQAADGDVLRKNDYSSLRVDELGTLVRHPAIGATAAALSGADGIRLWHDQLLFKPPGGSARVGWHTDRQYWQSCTSDDMLTAWVGFHDVDEVNGAVGFLPGSHRWSVTGLDFFSQDNAGLEASIAAQGFDPTPVVPRMKRGQVSFHHCRTVHGSSANLSTAPRRSIAIHLQPASNRWRPGSAHPNDTLVRRNPDPDYTDPAIQPTLWPLDNRTAVR